MASDPIMHTYTYKAVGDLPIQADIYRLGSRSRQPVIVWIHGGALIFGSRSSIPAYQLKTYLEAGFTVISIDYRLAPETRLPGIIEDLQDAIQWVREKAPGLIAIDPDRMAVIGHSAGGYLTLMTGFCTDPPPKAIVSFYGYGDIIGPWYSQPDPYYCQQGMIAVEEAYGAVRQTPLAESEGGNRFLFYLYCRQHGLWPQEVAGQDPRQNPGWFSQYCPIQNVTGKYAPALLIHGDQDMDVPYEQSVEMAAALARRDVDHQFLTLKDRGHGFDGAADAPQDPLIIGLFGQVVDFLIQKCSTCLACKANPKRNKRLAKTGRMTLGKKQQEA
jgi:acetyl esterase/lipase